VARNGELIEFGDVTVDLRGVRVMRAGSPVPLEPKTFDVLRHLIEHRDRVVTKDELLDAVWKDTFVTPNVLTRAIAQLRKALGDDAFEARYIETVAKRGYRFIAPLAATAACRHRSADQRATRPTRAQLYGSATTQMESPGSTGGRVGCRRRSRPHARGVSTIASRGDVVGPTSAAPVHRWQPLIRLSIDFSRWPHRRVFVGSDRLGRDL
jgi:DNA-binding winged helix-turn-helix (wHTH) protein